MTVPVEIKCPTCGWCANWDSSPGFQHRQFVDHLDFFHDRRKNMQGPSIIQLMWFELDKYIEKAMKWEGASNNPEGDAIDQARIEWLDDKLQKTEQTSIGRGMAEAILIACKPFFENSDQVVALAVKRYQAKKLGEEAPETPGFMGSVSGEAVHIAAKGNAPGRPVKQEQAKQEPQKKVTKKPSTPAPSKKNPPAPSGVDMGIVFAARGAYKGGFTIEQIMESFNITEEQARAAVAE